MLSRPRLAAACAPDAGTARAGLEPRRDRAALRRLARARAPDHARPRRPRARGHRRRSPPPRRGPGGGAHRRAADALARRRAATRRRQRARAAGGRLPQHDRALRHRRRPRRAQGQHGGRALGADVLRSRHHPRARLRRDARRPRPERQGVRAARARAELSEPADGAQPDGRLDERPARDRHGSRQRADPRAQAALDRRGLLGRAAQGRPRARRDPDGARLRAPRRGPRRAALLGDAAQPARALELDHDAARRPEASSSARRPLARAQTASPRAARSCDSPSRT